ncbi:MAG: hypothetical protein ACNA7M_14020, partial [Roseovarius sp.]
MSEPANPLPDLDALAQLDARLRALVTRHPEVAGLDISEVLRIVPGKRAVLAGHLDGRAVVARLVEQKYSDALAKEWAELQRIWPYMREGRYRVAEPILYLPEARLLIVEQVTGDPLLEHLWHAEVDTRPQHFRPAAEWLRRYVEMSEGWRPGNAKGWLARAQRVRTALLYQGYVMHLRRRLYAAITRSSWAFYSKHESSTFM